jgi:hypothetical protein
MTLPPWDKSLLDVSTTHSHGIKPHPHNKSVAKDLLAKASQPRVIVMDETVDISSGKERFVIHPKTDHLPLIDQLQAATFRDDVGMQWVEDKYALRMLLRKAHCFTLDSETSALVADFSLAIAPDIDAARQLAVPPFPVTWFELDNRARLKRASERGAQLTNTAKGLVDGEPVASIGWLIQQDGPNSYCATYYCSLDQGMMSCPVGFAWITVREPGVWVIPDTKGTQAMNRLLFGMSETNCNPDGAALKPASFQLKRFDVRGNPTINAQEFALIDEIKGELRHIFGLLVALGAGQLGAVASTVPQPKPDGPPPMMKGKPLFPLEHKILTIKLSKRTTVEKVTMRAITGIKHRWHEVRGHFRTKYNPDGSVKWRVPVKPHERGDERLGKIEKRYEVKK